MIEITKKTKIIVAVVLLLVFISIFLVGVFVVWQPFSNRTNSDGSILNDSSTKTDVNAIKTQALKASSENKIDEAKDLYNQARKIYLSSGDTQAVMEIDSQIYILDHLVAPTNQSSTNPTSVGAGGASK